MSDLVRVLSAAIALSSIGMATASSDSQSSLISLALAAASLAMASSPATTLAFSAASADSLFTTTRVSSTSLLVWMSTGCRAMSSSFISPTLFSAPRSFSSPTS